MAEVQKSGWDKLDVILKPLGGLLTALAVTGVGLYGSRILDRRQAADTNARLYAQIMSQREDAETSLRKDMFNSIIGSFLKPKSAGYAEQILNLELLAHNFHEALDLAPLFKSVYAEVSKSNKGDKDDYLRRLDEAADEVKSKQIAALEDSGGKLDASINLDDLENNLEGMTLLDGTLNLPAARENTDPALLKTNFKVEGLFVDKIKRRIRVKLEVKTPKNNGGGGKEEEFDTTFSVFWISPFDFPMIDNTRLPHGQRCAIVLRKMGNPTAQLTLVYFPGSRASLKEKPFFDEAMSELLSTSTRVGGQPR
ncbi:MAG: hypothetical protein ACXW18_07390 [Pyrinomonadaceae bacterium]